jgi:hypothetical protein
MCVLQSYSTDLRFSNRKDFNEVLCNLFYLYPRVLLYSFIVKSILITRNPRLTQMVLD